MPREQAMTNTYPYATSYENNHHMNVVAASANNRSFELSQNIFAEAASRWLMWLAIAAFFLISPMVLYQLGFSYEDAGGNPLEKMHPGTFLVVLALLLQITSRGISRGFITIFTNNFGLTFFAATTTLLIIYAIFVQKTAFTPIIDTFGLPIIIFVSMLATSRKCLNQYANFIHIFFVINALLAIFEYVTGERLTPYVAGVLLVENDWRSTAFLGHPLNNAVLTGAYILLLCSQGGTGLSRIPRSIQLVLQLGAMVAFGARASLVLMVIMISLMAIKNASAIFVGRMRLSLAFLAVLALVLPVFAAAILGLEEVGFFDRLIDRFIEDKGSASARIAMFQLFNYIPERDFLFGPDPDLIATLKNVEGIEAGIESFWVAFILNYGLVMSIIFFIGLAGFCQTVIKHTNSFALYIFIFFFIVASTSVSLSAKTTVLGMLIIMLFSMRPPRSYKSRDS